MNERNKNRPGYKETKVGWIPEEWQLEHLGEVASVRASNVDKKSNPTDIPVRLCNYTDVYYNETITDREGYMEATAKQAEIKKFLLKKGDVIITKDSETPDDIAIPAYVAQDFENLVCGYHLALIRPKKNYLHGAFLNKLFQLQFYRYYFFTLANGVTRFGLTMESTTKALILLPPLPEQEKISEVLGCWDEGLEHLEKLIEAKKLRKKGLMQKLLTGEKRLPDFQKAEWKETRLGDVFNRVTKKNKAGCDNNLTISGPQGLINQEEYFKKRIASTDNAGYYLLKNGEFAYNKSYCNGYPLGAIKRLDRYAEGVVSTLYICFSLKKDAADSNFMAQYFENGELDHEIYRVAQEGARNHGLLNITAEDFFNTKMTIPPTLDEQRAIAAVLETADEEVRLLEAERDALAEQKKGLMQKLLTGEKRLPAFQRAEDRGQKSAGKA